MNEIAKLITQLCPSGVPHKPLWEVTIWDKRFNEVDNFKQPVVAKYDYLLAAELKSLATESGDIKLLTTNKTNLWTSQDSVTKTVSEGEVVAIPWGGNPIVQYYKGKFLTADNRIAITRDEKELNTKFLYYFLCANLDEISTFYRGSGIKHPSMAKVLEFRMPIPPLEIQTEIVKTLDKFIELEAELEAELDARTSQYGNYRRELLDSRRSQPGYEKCTLGEISIKVSSGSTPLANSSRFYENGTIPWLRTQEVRFNEVWETEVRVTEAALKETGIKWIPKNCVIIAISGATAGRSAVNKIPLTTNQHCCNFQIDPQKADYRFVFHWVSSNYEDIKSFGRGVRSDLSASMLKDYPIYLPPLNRQKEIATLLDKFDLLTRDMTSGIPAELTARRQQYEYYRNKLLTFKELEVA